MDVLQLQERVRSLEAELAEMKGKGVSRKRNKIVKISSEVVDSNPYR